MSDSFKMRGFIWTTGILLPSLLFFSLAAADTPPSTPSTDGHTAAPTGTTTAVKAGGNSGDIGDVNIKGTRKEQLQVGKLDPPGAFNLEDIQNFPEDRLQPVLNNPLTFEEGRDFSHLMDFQEDRLAHPWLPELSQTPFLTMKTAVEKPPREWTFSIIDQSGNPVSKQDGKGNPPPFLTWNGDDSQRDHAAVDTVYIPQLATTDREGYHHTYSGEPAQFTSLVYNDKGRTVIELSSKRLFQEKKTDFSKEAPVVLDKVIDMLREADSLPFVIQPYDNDNDLAKGRQEALATYFSDKLHIPKNQITLPETLGADKRGSAMAIIVSAAVGGAAQ
jgi:hypothetical protein